MHLLREIEKFMRDTNMPWTKFGRLSVRDPRFVEDLRNGRQPGNNISQRVINFMKEWRSDHAC
ncbi:hypothetical protein [Parasphingorhabdus halotolerans]|uniref:Uncharacterized protein n=1 Tax=Parasphingorhabdus halotolerans TaxID=2725558 RepID=A0A6H2DL75_9SPHN|nr:hypothetical protein [Parasphingorhabdus halotolerans]QJB69422.1 hypothetical protein HF685_09120 [Parasphingorhabdus halotolerans]